MKNLLPMCDPVKALIVDDDPSILMLMEEVFYDNSELSIRTEGDSQTAFDLLGKERFDILITDLIMPEVDGLTLMERAMSLDPETLVVIITGFASLETTLKAIHGGVYDYITKPFRLEEFRLLVHNAAMRVRLVQEIKELQDQKQALETHVVVLEKRSGNQQVEILRFREEMARLNELESQVAGSTGNDQDARKRLSSYLRMLETTEERYEREIHHLEELFSSGRLASEEFELARQSLKTVI